MSLGLSPILIDAGVGLSLFVVGTILTARNFVKRDRAVFIAIALSSPVLAVATLLQVIAARVVPDLPQKALQAHPSTNSYQLPQLHYRMQFMSVSPPYVGVKNHRDRWASVYERQLQRNLQRVQGYVERHFVSS